MCELNPEINIWIRKGARNKNTGGYATWIKNATQNKNTKYRFGCDKIEKINKHVPPFPGTYCILTHSPLKASLYLDSPFCLDKPATQHRLHVAVAEVLVGLQNLTLHHLLQQKATKAPVEEGPNVLPVQNVLSSGWKPVVRQSFQLQGLCAAEGRASSQWWRPSPASCPECHEAPRTALPPGGRWAWETPPLLWAWPPVLCTASQTAAVKLMMIKHFLVKLAKITQA